MTSKYFKEYENLLNELAVVPTAQQGMNRLPKVGTTQQPATTTMPAQQQTSIVSPGVQQVAQPTQTTNVQPNQSQFAQQTNANVLNAVAPNQPTSQVAKGIQPNTQDSNTQQTNANVLNAIAPNQQMNEIEDEQTKTTQDQQTTTPQSSMRNLLDIVTTLGRAAYSLKGRDIGQDIKSDVQTAIRNKVTGEPNK